MLCTSRDRRTGAYATTVSLYGFIKLENFLTTEEVDELKAELENEISRTNNLFHKRQLEIQREYLDHDGVGNMELAMFPKVFASEPRENTSYISLLACLSVRELFFSLLLRELNHYLTSASRRARICSTLASTLGIPSNIILPSQHIPSADPLQPPSINPQYLNNLYGEFLPFLRSLLALMM